MLQQALSPMFDALEKRDPDRLAAFFAADAKLTSEHFNTYSGPVAIKESLARRFAADPEVAIEISGVPDVRLVTDDVAVVECEFRTRNSSAAPDAGRSVSIVKRTDEGWKIHSHWLVTRT